MNYIIYRIYYGSNIVYLGRTHQDLKERIRGHVFNNPRMRVIDINRVSKIEYAECTSEADMFLYEIYYINKLKPQLNTDDKAIDDLSITLPDLTFKEWHCDSWLDWQVKINGTEFKRKEKLDFYKNIEIEKAKLIAMKEQAEISNEEFGLRMKEITKKIADKKYEDKEISIKEYFELIDANSLQ